MFLPLMLSAAILFEQGPADVAGAQPTAPPVKEKKICRSKDPIVGTRIGGTRRICRTRQQWDRDEEESQRTMRQIDEATAAQLCKPADSNCVGASPNPE